MPVAKRARHGTLEPMPSGNDPSNEEPDDKPHYHGHRERLRERFRNAGPDALSDYELLELALFAINNRITDQPS